MDISQELELLLNNFLITKENNSEAYYKIKSKIKKLREFATNKLGCDIIINSSLVKLEKIPTIIDQTFKIEAFDSQKDYILFVLLIMFLEEKSREEQFILSNLTTFITNTLATFDKKEIIIDFKDYSSRKSLVDVLKYATKLGIIKLKDGNDNLFKEMVENEVLYENTGISHYIIRQFKDNIFSYNSPSDFLNTTNTEELLDKKRFYTYRNLLFYPVFHYSEFDSDIYNYFLIYRNRIINDLDGMLDGNLLIYKNMALLTTTEKLSRLSFPNNRKVMSDIILLVNDYLTSSDYETDKFGFITLDKFEVEQLLIKIHNENNKYFSKEYRIMKKEKFINQVVTAMKNFKLLNTDGDIYRFSPVTYLINGNYPSDDDEIKEDTYEQISISLEV